MFSVSLLGSPRFLQTFCKRTISDCLRNTAQRPLEPIPECPGSRLLEPRDYVGIGVQRELDAGVPELFPDDLRMNSLRQDAARMSVPEVVESHPAHPIGPELFG